MTVLLERRGPVAVLTIDRTTEDQREGMAAFFEKRPPEVTGR